MVTSFWKRGRGRNNFLNISVEEVIFVEPPLGLNVANENCLESKKALYGLKKALYVWNSLFDTTMANMGLWAIDIDPSLYELENRDCYLTVYVDDGLVVAQNETSCKQVINNLNESFETKLTSGSSFLGMELLLTDNFTKLSQTWYVKSILEKFKMSECSAVITLINDAVMLLNEEIFEDGKIEDCTHYQNMVESLLYADTLERPDILSTVNLLSRFNTKPQTRHLTAAMWVLEYLKGSLTYAASLGT